MSYKNFIYGVILLWIAPIWAQVSDGGVVEQFPGGMPIRKLDGMDAWRINFSFDNGKVGESTAGDLPQGNASSGYLPIKYVLIARTQPVWHVETFREKGEKYEQWFDGKTHFFKTPQRGTFFDVPIKDAPSMDGPLYFDGSNFPECEWASSKNFVALKDLGPRKCLYYAEDGKMLWVDAETRFPVAWRNGSETRLFQRLPIPVEQLAMPNEVQQIGRAIEKNWESLTKPKRPRG